MCVESMRKPPFGADASDVKSWCVRVDVCEKRSGIGIANFNDLKEGDVIEFFAVEKVAVESL